jgi:GMP synthase-like glutamine amidotransferase
MQIIIIDNGSSHIQQLKDLCGQGSRVIGIDQIPQTQTAPSSLVVLSGRHNHHAPGMRHPVSTDPGYYQAELDLIDHHLGPILGICLGFELIAYHAGAELVLLDRLENGTVEIHPTPQGEAWLGQGPLWVSEGHRWALKQSPQNYLVLAESRDGIEGIAHAAKPVVGLQFHAELNPAGSNGEAIFARVLKRLEDIAMLRS